MKNSNVSPTVPVHPFLAVLDDLAAAVAPYVKWFAELQAQAGSVFRSALDTPEVRQAFEALNRHFAAIDRDKVFDFAQKVIDYNEHLSVPKYVYVPDPPRRPLQLRAHQPAGFLARSAADDSDCAGEDSGD